LNPPGSRPRIESTARKRFGVRSRIPTLVAASAQANTADQRLLRLWHQRTASGGSADFTLGPGDIVEVSVPVVAELKDRTERVAGNGTLSLPYIGTLKAAGLTEKQLKAEMTVRLSAIMYNPQVDLFVKQYHSRQVAVVGQVDKPGLYDMTSPTNTLLDMLNDAGGVKSDAAQRVLFIPADEYRAARPAAGSVATADGPAGTAIPSIGPGAVQEALRTRHPIEINMGSLDHGGDPAALMLPARPGDMLVVPDAGEVIVQGWVDKPGSYKITPGLTVAGAVGAAGGALFASDGSSVTIMRNSASGEKIFISADLDRIAAGRRRISRSRKATW
jgi:polysaccharide biosynthesis/export protein